MATHTRGEAPGGTRRRLVALASAVLLLAAAAPLRAAADTVQPGIDWTDREQVIALPNGWTVAVCDEGHAPIRCVFDGDQSLGLIEYGDFPIDGEAPELHARLLSDDPAEVRGALADRLADFYDWLAEDRAEGCGADYELTTEPPGDAVLAGRPGIRYGFTGADSSGRALERTVGYQAVRPEDGSILIVLAAAYEPDGCVPNEGNLTVAAVDGIVDHLDELVDDAVLPPLPGHPPFTVPVGPDGVTYLPGGEDMLPVGPSALAIDPAGTVWIADLVDQRLLRYQPDGTRLEPVDLSVHDAANVVDLAVTADELVILDLAVAIDRYRVLRLDREGGLLAAYDIPEGLRLADGLSGLSVADDGAVLLELEGGVRLVQLVDAAGAQDVREVDGYPRGGVRYAIEPAEPRGNVGVVRAGDLSVEVVTAHDLVGLRFLDADAEGNFWVIVEEMADGPTVSVDQTVRHYAGAGLLLGSARVPLREQYVWVEHPLAVGPDGIVYALLTAEDHATVAPLHAHRQLLPVLPAPPAQRLGAATTRTAATALSRATFADGAVGEALLARDDLFTESLASGAAQGLLGAPLLLTAPDGLDQGTLHELGRLGVHTVHILGGERAVPAAVEQELVSYGLITGRFAGETRIETAAELAAALFPRATAAIVVRAHPGPGDPTQAFADALAAGGWAAEAGWPLLLTESERLSPAVAAYLRSAGVEFAYVVGGTAAIGGQVVDDLGALGVQAQRAAGANRFHTAVWISELRDAQSALFADDVILAEGQAETAWAPGFAAAALSGLRGAPILLTNGELLPPETQAWLSAAGPERPVGLLCAPFVRGAACAAGVEELGLGER